MAEHKMQQEFVVDGRHYCGLFHSQETLRQLPERMTFRPTDVLLVGHPKTGSTWLQEVAYLINHPEAMEDKRTTWIYSRVPMVEENYDMPVQQHFEALEKLPSPRIFKTHLDSSVYHSLLKREPACKVILLLRNPKDQLVSQFHFYRQSIPLGRFQGTWDDFFKELVKNKRVRCGDYIESITGWWEFLRERPNSTIVKYEDMKKKPVDVIRHLASFMEADLTAETVIKMAEHTSFANMKKTDVFGENDEESKLENARDESVSPFLRKGAVGDWKNYFNAEQNDFIDGRYQEWLEKTGISFDFE